MRFFQSTGPLDLAPGGSGTIVLAYIFAAPVATGNCPGASCDVKPANDNADLTIIGDPARMAAGVNQIDKIAGYLGNNNGTRRPDPTNVTQDEYITVPGSLLGKAKVAQTVFDTKFLLPFAPERPEFFLVPGNQQVTVLWARSATETIPTPSSRSRASHCSTDRRAERAVRPELPRPRRRGLPDLPRPGGQPERAAAHRAVRLRAGG